MIKNLNLPYMLMAMAIVCIHSVMEHHMFEAYYDVFLMLPFANFDVKDIGKRQRKCGNWVGINVMKTKITRLQYIDIAKGIAMICIILGHLGNASINRIVFTFHVPIFFFITGYFTNKKRDLNGFIKIRQEHCLFHI